MTSSERPFALTRLTVSDFRCYERAGVVLDGRPVVLTGPNGAGKTNMLEALSLLAPGRGLRQARLADLRRRGTGGQTADDWAVAVSVRGPDGDDIRLGTGTAGGERRVTRLNGAPAASASVFAAYLRLVWLTPAMDRLFIEGTTGRRRFLDRLVLGAVPAHGAAAVAYERAMKERSRLLRDGGGDRSWLDALEARMAEHGTAMAAARVTFVAALCRAIDATPASAFPHADVCLDGGLEARLSAEGPDAAQAWFRETLAQTRQRDGAAGRALTGPHRTDLIVRHRPKAMPAADCSTGEQKALLVGMVLANARLRMEEDRRPPVLLLDEIAAHLDADRRAALFDQICAMGAQAFMTGTDPDLFSALRGQAQFFRVADAQVHSAGDLFPEQDAPHRDA